MKRNMTIQLVNKVFRLRGYIGSNFNIADDKYMYYMPSDRCLVCYDAATDIDELRIKRSVNCVRCEPCTLCDNCKAELAGVNVCFQCITPDEVKLLDEGSRKRLNLIDCEQSVKDALHL